MQVGVVSEPTNTSKLSAPTPPPPPLSTEPTPPPKK